MNKIYILIALLSLISCQKKQTEMSALKVDSVSVRTDAEVAEIHTQSFEDSNLAQKWLIQNIEKNFKTAEGLIDSICTKDYATYKSDAIGVEYDGGMTHEAFEKKWKNKFDVKHAGIGTGFLISGQDWVKIKVNKCELSPVKLKQGFIFETTIEDVGATTKTMYRRDIKVVPSGNSFLISDVLEYQ